MRRVAAPLVLAACAALLAGCSPAPLTSLPDGVSVSVRQNRDDYGPRRLEVLVANGIELIDEVGDKLDVVMVPKVQGPEDIHYVDRLLAQLEAKGGVQRPIMVHAILETARGMANVEEICGASPRMQGLSLGPADLAASMGHRGAPGHPEVQAAIERAIRTIVASGKSAGTLTGDPALARRYLDLGASFVAVGIELVLMVQAARRLAGEFGLGPQAAPTAPTATASTAY